MRNPSVAVGDFVRFENTKYGCWAIGTVLSITDKTYWHDIVLDVADASEPEGWDCENEDDHVCNEEDCGIPEIGQPHAFGWSATSADIYTFRVVDRPAIRRDGFAQSDIDAAKAVLMMQVKKR